MTQSMKQYLWTYLALLALLFLTVAEYEWRFFPRSLAISLSISALKALLIGLIFMELKKENAVIRFTAGAALFWILIFYGLSSLDLLFR